MKRCIFVSFLFLGQQFPIAHRHVLLVLPWVEAFLDADGLEVRLPKVLEKFFILGYLIVLQDARDEMCLAFVFEGDFLYRTQVVIEAVLPLDVVDEPRLVGKAVAEMSDGKWQDIVKRFDRSKEGSVACLLEADELKEAMALVVYLFPDFRELEYIGVGKVGFDGDGRIEDFLHVAEKQEVDAGKFGEPTISEVRQGACGKPSSQTFPNALMFFFERLDVYHFVHKQRERFPFFQELVGEGLAVVGFEKASQQSVEGMVVSEDGHGVSSKFKTNCRSSVFRFLGEGSSNFRTPNGVNSFTVRTGNSLQVMKYCAFFITTPIFFSS